MEQLLEEFVDLWHQTPDDAPAFERAFEASEQAAREAELKAFLEAVQAELHALPRTRTQRQAVRERIASAFARFAKTGLELEDRHLEVLLGGGLSSVGSGLARQARRFDREVSTADILQASRNAWTACGLQMLLGLPMRLTPAIFAYSMLYPYTDNYLDDPATSREAKLGFSARFGQRLAGETVAPANEREAAIWRLVGMIEGQYARADWPQVFTSLLAIHRAQQESIRLLRRAGDGADVLRLSFEKGGASVLADGYLAAGSLAREQARFVFGWGVLLQLADDLQDVREDRRDGVLTLFSQPAGREPLDGLTSRCFRFAGRVMELMHRVAGPGCSALEELIERSSRSLLIRSAGEAGESYTSGYLARLETHSPFRFAFLNDQRQRAAQRTALFVRLFEAFLEGDEDEPAFPLLPSSLMPRL